MSQVTTKSSQPNSSNNEKPTGKTGCKEWLQPQVLGSYETFIDDNCVLDAEGYPLYPNGETVFVKLPNQEVKNFLTVGFPKIICSETSCSGEWKVTRVFCLGVLACNKPKCKWAGCPPTGHNQLDEYLKLYVFLFLCP
jgi:hypothetical protein